MTQPSTDGKQFIAESAILDEEERMAREILDRKHRERKAQEEAKRADEPAVVEEEVVNPDDDPLHMELSQNVEQREDGELYDKRDGRLVEWNDQGLLRHAKAWPHRKFTYMGTTWEYRDPKRLASMFLGASTNKKTSPQRRLEGLIGYLTHVLSERSMDKMRDRAFDYDDELDVEHMGQIMQYIQQRREGDLDVEALNRAERREVE